MGKQMYMIPFSPFEVYHKFRKFSNFENKFHMELFRVMTCTRYYPQQFSAQIPSKHAKVYTHTGAFIYNHPMSRIACAQYPWV